MSDLLQRQYVESLERRLAVLQEQLETLRAAVRSYMVATDDFEAGHPERVYRRQRLHELVYDVEPFQPQVRWDRMSDVRIADALERIAAALERFTDSGPLSEQARDTVSRGGGQNTESIPKEGA